MQGRTRHYRLKLIGTFAAVSFMGTTQANQAEPAPPSAQNVTVIPKTTFAPFPEQPARPPVFTTLTWPVPPQERVADWRGHFGTYQSPLLESLMPRIAPPAEPEEPVSPPLPPSFGASQRACSHSLGVRGKFAAVMLERDMFGFERMVVDVAGDELRHPASLTKMMTLLLAFRAIERGEIATDDQVHFSAHALSASPVNLANEFAQIGRRHLTLDTAMKAAGIKSANDAAIAIAEHVAGSENAFVDQMNALAAEIGMSKTVYRNASGLPDARQVTTARDTLVLMRYMQQHYAGYLSYLSERSFSITKSEKVLAAERRRAAKRGRNHSGPQPFVRVAGHFSLLGMSLENGVRIEWGKTGFVGASGFNRAGSGTGPNGGRVMSAVFGGQTAAAADNCMKTVVSRLSPHI